MTRIDTRILTLVLACLATATATHARQPEGQGEPQPVVRTYDVSDLMRAAADYPLDSEIVPPTGYGAGGATGAGVFADAPVAKAAAKPDELNALMTLISEFVDPDSWKDNGGSVGSMRGFGTLLVVSQTEANHAKVEQLLDEVRRNAGPARVVAVRATWVAVPNAEAPAAGTVVGDDLIAKHGVYCAGQTVCFSGQTVHVTSGRGHTVVHDLTPIVGDNAVAFDPTVQRVQAGVSLQIAPQLVPGADVAIVDVQSFVSEWAAPGPAAPARGAAATQPSGTAVQVSADVDRINVLAQEMKTTLRVPLGKKFVVGGMTLEPAGEARGDRQLCLVVEITAGK